MPAKPGQLRRRSLIAILAAAPALADLLDLWRDPGRNRSIPVRLRLPSRLPAPFVIVSHGLGGSRDAMGYLGRALQQAGLATLHLQHPGSDASLMEGRPDRLRALREGLTTEAARDRLRDVRFALDRLEQDFRCDPARIAIAGHSFGSRTALTVLGMDDPAAAGLGLPDRRLRAGVLLSPNAAEGATAATFAAIAVPTLHITGTRDGDDLRLRAPVRRLLPARLISQAPAELHVLQGANHFDFGGEGVRGDPAIQAETARLAVAFFRRALAMP